MSFLFMSIGCVVLTTSVATISKPVNVTDLDNLFDEFFRWRLSDHPEMASVLGLHEYDDRLMKMSPQAFQQRYETINNFIARAKHYEQDTSGLNKTYQNHLKIFIHMCQLFAKGYEHDAHLYPVSFVEGPHMDMDSIMNEHMRADSEYSLRVAIQRLRCFAIQIDEIILLLREGVRKKKTRAAVSMKHVVSNLLAIIMSGAKNSSMYKFFEREETKNVSSNVLDAVQKDALDVIENQIFPAMRRLAVFIEEDYMPHARLEPGVVALPDGELYYQLCIEYHLTKQMSPQQLHQMGIDEVYRIRKDMQNVINELGLNMSTQEFAAFARNDTRFEPTSMEELLKKYDDLNGEISALLPKYFKRVPKTPLRLIKMSAETSHGPIAMYLQGSVIDKQPGRFYVNVNFRRTLYYLLPALALHEGNPGHHFQSSYVLEMTALPKFRQMVEDRAYNLMPNHMPLITSYVEGWGLYCEHLGHEMGVYKTPYERYGHYSMEMLRACRLVIDTGIHAFGWSFEKAMDFAVKHIASSRADVESEITRYITWPGQALGYKVGELEFKRLRKWTEGQLGNKFEIGEFHDIVMQNYGPLQFVEEALQEYVENKKRGRAIE